LNVTRGAGDHFILFATINRALSLTGFRQTSSGAHILPDATQQCADEARKHKRNPASAPRALNRRLPRSLAAVAGWLPPGCGSRRKFLR
jgi:hypothetical protein